MIDINSKKYMQLMNLNKLRLDREDNQPITNPYELLMLYCYNSIQFIICYNIQFDHDKHIPINNPQRFPYILSKTHHPIYTPLKALLS